MKNIKFTVSGEMWKDWITEPVPAVAAMPQWYKDMESFAGKKELVVSERKTNQTAKRCIPLREGMTAGYYITTPADMIVTVNAETGDSSFTWLTYTDLLTAHDPFQIEGFPITSEFTAIPFKFYNPYLITTPPGYSCLFISPLLRPDIPFYTLPAVVDTDKHDVPIHLPFFLRKDFEGLVPKGTPMVQVIPFKRDDWKMELEKTPLNNLAQRLERQYSFATRAYKKLGTWSRKRFS
jgi:hypothetical protein